MSPPNNPGSSNNDVMHLIRILSKQKASLIICHMNALRLSRKIDELRYIFESSGVDINCVSKTWFNVYIADGVIYTFGFSVNRNDRGLLGGGVVIFLRKSILQNSI